MIEEEEFVYDTSILKSFAKRFLATSRKLRPTIKERPPRNLDMVENCRIVIHVVKAENVPIRYDVIRQYQNFNEQDQGGAQRSRARRGPHRPTANRPERQGDPDYDD